MKCDVCGKTKCLDYSRYERFIREIEHIKASMTPLRELLETQFRLTHAKETDPLDVQKLLGKIEETQTKLSEEFEDFKAGQIKYNNYKDFKAGQINGLGIALALVKELAGIED